MLASMWIPLLAQCLHLHLPAVERRSEAHCVMADDRKAPAEDDDSGAGDDIGATTFDLGFSPGDSRSPSGPQQPVILRLEAETAAETRVGW